MTEFIASRKLRFGSKVLDRAKFGNISPITEKVIRNSGDKSLLTVLDADPEKANSATRTMMRKYLGIK